MQSETFEVFWQKAILPYCNSIFNEIPSNFVERYDVKLDIGTEFKNKIFAWYEYYRKDFHKYYFNNSTNALIDRHKICSCLMGAMVKCRPVSYTLTPKLPIEIFLSNYKIAFLSGVKALYLLRIAQWILDGNMTDFVDAICSQKMFKFPKTQSEHDEYSVGRIKALALTDCRNQAFDILAYADMLYWIERFNDENIFRIVNQSDI